MQAAIHRHCHDYFFARDWSRGLSRSLSELENNLRATPDELASKQVELLRRVLVHARDHTPFYRERFAACGFVPEDFGCLDDLKSIPPLTKFDIRDRLEELTAESLTADHWHQAASGGTTGHVLWFRRDNACLAYKEAGILRYERAVGWDHGQWIGLIWPAVIDHPRNSTWKSRLRNWLGPRLCVLPVIGEEALEVRSFMAELTRRQATLLRVFPNAAVPVAERIQREGLPRPQLKAVLSMGEVLQPGARRLFEDVFQCPVIDSYRSRETGPVAQQCLSHGSMHIASDLVAVEIDETRSFETEDGGRAAPLLITDLRNFGMPLIRYDVGDVGRLDDQPCGCGSPLPVLKDLGGRVMDVLYTTDLRPIHSINLIPNFIEACGVTNQFQIIQDEVKRIRLRLTPPRPEPAMREQLQERARVVFGRDVDLEIEIVDEIPLGRSGKYRLMVCNVPKPEAV